MGTTPRVTCMLSTMGHRTTASGYLCGVKVGNMEGGTIGGAVVGSALVGGAVGTVVVTVCDTASGP